MIFVLVLSQSDTWINLFPPSGAGQNIHVSPASGAKNSRNPAWRVNCQADARGDIGNVEQINFEIIAVKILNYLNQHPDAQDSLEGITSMWLRQVDISYQSARIGEVLKALAAKNIIREQEQRGSLTYKINPLRREEISSLLEIIKF